MSLNFLQTSLIFFCCMVIARGISRTSDDDWKLATATYSRATDAPATNGGACGFRDPSKLRVAGLSTALFRRGAACGGCFVIRCVDHILWCLSGSPPVAVTATDFCAPNYGLPIDDGGWCNDPNENFELSESAFTSIAERRADMVPVQYMRVKCEVDGGMRFTLSGSLYFLQVLISNVGWDGEVTMVKVRGWRTGWIAMARNWGQNWQCGADLIGQSLSFEVSSGGRIVASYNVAPAGWRFGQTFEGKQFEQ